jgi:hypothetical protein
MIYVARRVFSWGMQFFLISVVFLLHFFMFADVIVVALSMLAVYFITRVLSNLWW